MCGDWSVIDGEMRDFLCRAAASGINQLDRKNKNKANKLTEKNCSRQSAVTTAKGRWQARGYWTVIDGDMKG